MAPLIIWLALFLYLKKAEWPILLTLLLLLVMEIGQLLGKPVLFYEGARVEYRLVLWAAQLLTVNCRNKVNGIIDNQAVLVVSGAYALCALAYYLALPLSDSLGYYLPVAKVILLTSSLQIAAWWGRRQKQRVLRALRGLA